MAVLSVRVPDELATRFDAAAAAVGGRSARLHQLVRAAAFTPPAGSARPRMRRDALRLMVRLAAPDAAHVERQATAMAMPKAAWVAALVSCHGAGTPRFSRPAERTLLAIHGELRRIGINVNQIARALNTAVLEGRVLDLQLGGIEDLGGELRAHVAGLGEAFRGNLSYWEVPR